MIQEESPRRQTILVVDDTPEDVVLLVEFLKGVFRVKVALKGSRALELAAAEPPDLILLDVMMPEMDGYDVCRKLKGDPATREIPVLFLTSKDSLQNEARGFASGGADYITKPFSPALVLARVRTQLEQRRLLTAEKDLLEKTFKGALAAILGMISLAEPASCEWSLRLSELAEQVAGQLGMEEPWMVGLAAALSQIGTLGVPAEVLARIKTGGILKTEERMAYNRVPDLGFQLLKDIPRLEGVAEMVYYSQKNFNGGGFPHDLLEGTEIPLGGRILRACLGFMHAYSGKRDPLQCISDLLLNRSFYDPEVTFALNNIIQGGFFYEPEKEKGAGALEIPIKDLVAGQILDSSIETKEGQLLIRGGTVLGPGHLRNLANYASKGAIKGPVTVRAAG
jgi:response regulator RpfG family c-di-GMP phosphodiesterase